MVPGAAAVGVVARVPIVARVAVVQPPDRLTVAAVLAALAVV